MFALPAAAVVVGQLLAIAFASGINLYAAVAIIGLATRLGWVASLPPGLSGLANGVVIASAIALFIIESIIDKIPLADSAWDALHTLIRPSAAAFLAILALDGASWEARAAGAILAGGTALAAHGLKAGLRVIVNAVRRPVFNASISLAEDLLAIAMALAALVFPSVAVAVMAVAILASLAIGPDLWRAAALGVRALIARGRGFFGDSRWRNPEELPTTLRTLVRPDPLGLTPLRAVRATLTGWRGIGRYRNGWLVLGPAGASFLYPSLLGARSVALPPLAPQALRPGILADAAILRGPDSNLTFYLLKDGPPAEVIFAELSAEDHEP